MRVGTLALIPRPTLYLESRWFQRLFSFPKIIYAFFMEIFPLPADNIISG